MHTIYKYPIDIVLHQTVVLPLKATIIHVGLDPQGKPCVWAEVCTDIKQTVEWNIYIVGTGNPRRDEARTHLGSFKENDMFMWHVYTD